jgi:hypothetical protein
MKFTEEQMKYSFQQMAGCPLGVSSGDVVGDAAK